MLATHQQILVATLGVLEQISTNYRTTRWVGTFNDFVTYDESQTLTTAMVKDLLSAIKSGEVNLPMSFIGGDTIYVDTEAYGWLGDKL